MSDRIRIVGLHGRTQTGEVLRTRLDPLVQKLKEQHPKCDFSFPDGPVELPKQEGDAVARRSWFATSDESDGSKGQELGTKVPVECRQAQVLLGFSQGGLLAVAAALKCPSVRLVIAAGVPDSNALTAIMNAASESANDRYLKIILLAGDSDLIVKPESTRALYERLSRGGVLCEFRSFQGNHFFPIAAKNVEEFRLDMLEWQQKAGTSESCQVQRDELEVLRSIYGETLKELVPAPDSPHDLNLKVSLELDGFTEVKTKPRLVMSALSGYPRDSDAYAWIEGAPYNRMTLDRLVKAAVQSLTGEMQFFACITAIQEALTDIQSLSEEPSSLEQPVGKEDELDEKETLELISKLTEEARTRVIQARGLVEEDTRQGQWSCCIGLIGKPSCGKSTLFNAITQNALLGKREAEEGAQPFTTIDPNLGTVRCRISPSFTLQVALKDVAGLVPGAYKGLGKGNRFLNDLLDADALIHVCDSSGTADDGGRAALETPSPEQVSRDALWVLREVHLWIYGNVTAKWPRFKKGRGPGERTEQAVSYSNRVCQLFAGYHAPPSMILRASKLAELDLERAPGFSAEQRHRLCAFFIAVRFPVILALNKVDFYFERNLGASILEQVVESSARIMGELELVARVSARVEKELLDLSKRKIVEYDSDAGQVKVLEQASIATAGKTLQLLHAMGGSTGVHDALVRAVHVARPLMVEAIVDRERRTFLMYPGSTVFDLFEACVRNDIAAGDFVRAEEVPDGSSSGGGGRTLSRDAPLAKHLRVRISTNKKVAHQQQHKPSS